MTDAPRDRESGSLDAAIAATQRHFDGESTQAHDTEQRILTSVRLRARPRRAVWLAPVAAAFVVSAAFATGIGGRIVDHGARLFDPATPQPAPTAPPATPRAVLAPASASASALEPTPPEPPPTAPAPSAATTAQRLQPPVEAPNLPPSTSTTPAPAADDELTWYKQAHRAHFTDRDYARALAAWDQYLARAPRGTFALEARYNRAVALHRLGNRAAAIEALRPFADGAYGRYRQEEARQLIEQGW